ncbi:Tim17/Tim22/Tim23/Pmp24 family-domain-containing protein [Chytriomyces cf. hyalinus JEL632]|nr:Tim17/Tim22/Tim23/Pmp24 family-domain-containing protein [Chytriomyces cf. hyalinus JEL632]
MSSQQQPVASEFVADAEAAAPQVTSVNSSSVSVTRFSLPGSYLHPITENNPSQLLFINDNPMGVPGVQQKERLSGSFGPLPMRTNYDKLLYGTGAAYFSGFIGGGLYGAYRGLQIAQGNSFNIRYNSVLNSIGRQGPRISNSLGVMTMGWGLLDNLFSSFRGGKSDYYNHVTAAFLSGALFKSTAGLRPALIAGGLMATVVGGYGLSETFNSTSAKATVKSALPAGAPAPAAA